MLKSSVSLPASCFAESSGTIVNYEGRAQKFFKAVKPGFSQIKQDTKESWRWLNEAVCYDTVEKDLSYNTTDEVLYAA